MYLRSKLTITLMTLCAVVALHILASETFGQNCSCTNGTITCTGTITASDFTAGSRAGTNGGTCATPVACSNPFIGSFHYRATAFTNTIAGTTCYTVNLANIGCAQSIQGYAYVTSYNPAAGQECTNYLADNAFGVAMGTNDSFSFNVTLNQRVIIVVLDRTPGGDCAGGTYTLTISHTGASATTCPGTPSASDGVVSGTITTSDGAPLAGTVMNLSGTQSRKTITDANGNYHFDSVETNGFYTVTPARSNYSFSPAERSFSQLGNSTEAVFTGTAAGDKNPLDTPEYFVRQHYLDFLGREPDEAGFNFWSDQMLECGTDAGCLERRRINVSAAYFLSIEFQQTGGLVDGLYRASYGVRPQFADFMPDTAMIARDVVVGRSGWEQLLAANKQAFLDDWVNRPAFRAVYDLLTNDRYVDSLIAHTGISFTPSERDSLVNGLTFGTFTRAGVLQRIAEDQRFVAAKRNDAFVMMEYFGYLRRDPDASGFQFWLNKLNEFGGNFEEAEMVKAFIVSGEYRDRFPR
jgi:hypothetical protein